MTKLTENQALALTSVFAKAEKDGVGIDTLKFKGSELAELMGIPTRSIGGIVGSLYKRGFAVKVDEKEGLISLTEAGVEVAIALNVNDDVAEAA